MFIGDVVILMSWFGEGVELLEGGVGVVYIIDFLLFFVEIGICKK